MGKIQVWQWPNVLAIDASMVAAAWLGVFAGAQSAGIGAPAYCVLGLSVWLTYMADRLLDVRARTASDLRSIRHRFAKFHWARLAGLWLILLLPNVGLALGGLEATQFSRGLVLLLGCLTYTVLNQWLSRYFFPKELLVALIFCGGTQVFLPEFTDWLSLGSFALICFCNCMMIGWKESRVDAELKVRSLAGSLNRRWAYPLGLLGIGLALASDTAPALITAWVALIGLQLVRPRIAPEIFRVLCDAALLIGPGVYLLVPI